jgi:hypothetical protein
MGQQRPLRWAARERPLWVERPRSWARQGRSANQRLLGSLARLEERREVRSLAQLGNPQLQRAKARIETTLAISVAVIEPLGAALVTAGADQAFDISLHQNLQHRLRHGSQKIAIAALLQQFNCAILLSVIGSSVVLG